MPLHIGMQPYVWKHGYMNIFSTLRTVCGINGTICRHTKCFSQLLCSWIRNVNFSFKWKIMRTLYWTLCQKLIIGYKQTNFLLISFIYDRSVYVIHLWQIPVNTRNACKKSCKYWKYFKWMWRSFIFVYQRKPLPKESAFTIG